jgi:type II secretory pathway component PulK
MSDRRGFALLAVLWVTVALASLVAGAAAHARAGRDGATARIGRVQARWAADGCLAAARAGLERAARSGRAFLAPPADTIAFANGAVCVLDALDPSARLHADSASAAQLALLDSVLSAERRDPATHREAFLTHDGDGRLNLNTAPPEVLATLPGIGAEALRVIRSERAWGRSISDIGALAGRLSPAAREALFARLPELMPMVTLRTGALILRAEGWRGGNRAGAVAVIEEVVVPAGGRVATVQRRLW